MEKSLRQHKASTEKKCLILNSSDTPKFISMAILYISFLLLPYIGYTQTLTALVGYNQSKFYNIHTNLVSDTFICTPGGGINIGIQFSQKITKNYTFAFLLQYASSKNHIYTYHQQSNGGAYTFYYYSDITFKNRYLRLIYHPLNMTFLKYMNWKVGLESTLLVGFNSEGTTSETIRGSLVVSSGKWGHNNPQKIINLYLNSELGISYPISEKVNFHPICSYSLGLNREFSNKMRPSLINYSDKIHRFIFLFGFDFKLHNN